LHCRGATNGVFYCDALTAETFNAPKPAVLQATYKVPTAVITGAATSSANPTATATGNAGNGKDGGGGGGVLSTGAEAGIRVGYALAGLAILGLGGWF
jgi:hypothetical protein